MIPDHDLQEYEGTVENSKQSSVYLKKSDERSMGGALRIEGTFMIQFLVSFEAA